MSSLYIENSYIKSNGRDLRLDFLRGLCVFIMVVDHISGKSPLYFITFGNAFFTSAAEGFFLISGIVTGLVYSKVIRREGLGAGLIKSAHRLLTIYLITISLTVITLFLSEHFHLFLSKGISLAQPIQLIQQLMVFSLSYNYIDVLIVYCLLFVILPYALILLESQKTIWLIVLSLGSYVIYILYPTSQWIPFKTFMNFCGVQLFFMIGLVLGYHHILEGIQHKINKKWLIITGFPFLILIILWNIFRSPNLFPFLQVSHELTSQVSLFFWRTGVYPGRFIASGIVFSFLYILLTLYWKNINRILSWLILPLGENSLFAYSFHVIVVLVYLMGAQFFRYDGNSYWLNGLLQFAGILIIWFFIKRKIFTPKPQNRTLYYALPAIIILGFILIETIYRIPLIHESLSPLLSIFLSQ